jgi:hypothetical protein
VTAKSAPRGQRPATAALRRQTADQTGGFDELHSHSGASHKDHTAGQQEVTCFAGRDDNDWWVLSELR